MDRAAINNLGILAEEEDEESVIGRSEDESDVETESEGDDDADEGVRRGEPNKFDGLCDGVLNAMALVHEALQDLLDLKDEMLQHSLPPPLLIQLAMVSGRVFRSISDLGMPVGELVRLVRVYSTPWEEKSTALKKLHEDYESKQRQLNIAIKRLQLVDSHSKRVAREKRIMNWEKLFSKMTSAKGHGRRWKFLIETIKQKAKLGLEHVQAYTKGLEESSESEEEEEDEATEAGPTLEAGDVDGTSENPESEALNGAEGSRGDDDEEDNEDGEGDDDDMTEGNRGDEGEEGSESRASGDTGDSEGAASDDVPTVTVLIGPGDDIDIEGSGSRSASPKKVRFEDSFARPMTIRPPMRDADAWTGQPDYDRSLFVRIYCPEGLEESELKCSLSYEGQMFKTPILDGPEEEGLDADSPEVEEERPSKRPQAARKGDERSNPDASQSDQGSSKSKAKQKRFYEYEIPLPDEVKEGIVIYGEKPPPEPENLRITVHQGQFEEIIAMATIDFKDIKELTLETVLLPPPHGDDEVIKDKSRANSVSALSSLDGESLSDSMDIPIMMDDGPDQLTASTPREDLVKNSEPLPFPLYSLHAGKSDAVHMPCGNVPLLMYWGKKERPLHFNRQCGTLGVYDLVFDVTGFDMTTTTKEDLHKEMVDEALSVVAFTPEAQEETVLKSEYDDMMKRHEDDIIYIQEEYEKRLNDLMQSLQEMQSQGGQGTHVPLPQQRPISVASRVSSTPGGPPLTPKRSERSEHSSYGRISTGPLPVSQQSLRPISRDKTMSDVDRERTLVSQDTVNHPLRPIPPKSQKLTKNFRIGRPLPKWGEHLPQDFLERLRQWEEETKQHRQELNEKTLKDIKDNLEKKLAGQHKLSKNEEQIYDALKDVSLPALFMPYKSGNIYNPRAHQYFHPTGATDVRLTQPPSVFQLPPLPNSKLSVVNLFELSKNFHNRGPAWLVERYIQQQQPVNEGYPQTPAPTSALPQVTTNSERTPFNDNMESPSTQRSLQREREVES
ncbi:uncharacterized protein LOC101862724 isoform X2 [Aplysia californica]|uniref:Uncharacterized protein LOC101862724 isoform X2 n=1 Tax=Aplysia californica TaxID=6500 RepID=A0ABM0JMG3_APLCA|nr:uncharacterized protein LOC101862724 isoform X2 [Aplysia californica]